MCKSACIRHYTKHNSQFSYFYIIFICLVSQGFFVYGYLWQVDTAPSCHFCLLRCSFSTHPWRENILSSSHCHESFRGAFKGCNLTNAHVVYLSSRSWLVALIIYFHLLFLFSFLESKSAWHCGGVRNPYGCNHNGFASGIYLTEHIYLAVVSSFYWLEF